jgi:deazaflavin-dependent oxidoreductase (nitroreductase family)
VTAPDRRPAARLLTRAVRRISATWLFALLGPYAVPSADRLVHRLTGGRAMLSSLLLPGLVLTTTGARSGLPRTTPLVCLAEDSGSWLVVGSNFGRSAHPAWTATLLAHPEARISLCGTDIPVRARLLAGAERTEAWHRVREFWPPYEVYQARIPRRIRLFRLTPR